MKNFFLLFLILLPISVHSQTIKGFGVKLNYTTNQYGWTNPDTAIAHLYHRSPEIKTLGFGFYGEFLNKKRFSVVANLFYRNREFRFNYDKYDMNGIKTGEGNVKNDISIFSLSVTPKIKLNLDILSFYVFGGIRFDYIFSKDIDLDFQNVFNNSEKMLLGLSAGFGSSVIIAKDLSLSLEFYYNPDLSKTFKSSTGDVRNNEFGLSLGIGIYNPKNK